MLYISILMQLSLSAATNAWSVSYSPKSICVFERTSVEFICSFDFPHSQTLQTIKWFKMRANQKQDSSQEGMFVYHSNPAEIHRRYKNRTTYANQDRNCSLTLYNVSKNDMGRYFFRFETQSYWGQYTGQGGIELNVAALAFRVTVKTQQTKGDVYESDSVTLTCSTENCDPTQGPFVWFRNGLLLAQATEKQLRFSSVSHRDFGSYSCGLKNSNATSTNQTLLDVRYSPKHVKITSHPSGDVQEKDSLTLTCNSDANPAVTNYTWFKISDTNISYVGCGSKYSVRSVGQTDAGRYFCVAINDIGSQNSTVIELTVKGSSRLHFMLAVTAVFLSGLVVVLLIFSVMQRRKKFLLMKQPAEKTVTLTEEVYENLRKCEGTSTCVTYADLILPPSSSDRPHPGSQESGTVIYSILRCREDTENITRQV